MTFPQNTLGGGYKGTQPLLIGNIDSGSDRSSSRKHLAKAFGNLYNKGLGISPLLNSRNIAGPFRTSFNSKDILTTYNEATDNKYGYAANQVGGNNLSRLNPNFNGVSRNGTAMYSGNNKFVHDSSDYSRFKKLQAMNRNYNDTTFAGSSTNTNNVSVQTALHRLRR